MDNNNRFIDENGVHRAQREAAGSVDVESLIAAEKLREEERRRAAQTQLYAQPPVWSAQAAAYADRQREPQPEGKRKKSGYLTKKAAAALVAVTLVLAICFGVGGGLLAAGLKGASGEAAQPSAAAPAETTQPSGGLVSGESGNTGTAVQAAIPSGTPLTVEQVVAKTAASVVSITTEQTVYNQFYGQYVTQGAGSGVIITADGYIVTNHHVIDGAGTIQVTLQNGDTHDAKLIGSNSNPDIAVLKIEASGLSPAALGDSDTLVVGEPAVVIGNPLGKLGGTVTDGIISALDREVTIDSQSMRLLQTNAAVNPGNSGGALFNRYGELVGVVEAKSSGSGIEGLGFAIPINSAREVFEDIMDFGYVRGQVYIGIYPVDITSVQMAMQYRVSRIGVYVGSVVDGSAAEAADLQPGDCIVSVGGTEVATQAELKAALREHSVGDTVTFRIDRDGSEFDVSLTLQEYVPDGVTTVPQQPVPKEPEPQEGSSAA